jgi:hypothetical protein
MCRSIVTSGLFMRRQLMPTAIRKTMNIPARIIPGFVVLALTFAGCSGGGSNGTSLAPSTNVQQVSGTLTIGTPSQSGTSSLVRRPDYVSAATTHAYIFINGSLTPNNASSTCTGTGTSGATGTTFCTIAWTTSVAVPASYTFQVETDNGTNVLAEGAASEALIAGVNTLGTLTLNGVVANASFATTSCVAGTAGTVAGTCSGNVTLSDAATDAITFTGTTAVPTAGNSPTTGTVYDNGAVTFAASTASGLVTGTAQNTGPNIFSTFAANTLTASGVSTTGIYTYAVKCATATTTGTFGITVGGGTSRTSGVNVLNTQLANESPVPTYLASVSTVATAPSYTCTNGVISSASGTLPVN